MGLVGSERGDHDVAEGDRRVLPVDHAVAVAVAGDDDLGVREGFGVGRGRGAVGPLAGGELGLDVAVLADGLAPEAAVLPGGAVGADGLVVDGVRLDGARESAVRDDGVRASGGGVGRAVGGRGEQGVAALGLVQLDAGCEELGSGLVAADGEQGEAGDAEGADGEGAGVGDLRDMPGDLTVRHRDLDVDGGAAVEGEAVRDRGVARRGGDRRGALGVVDEDGGDLVLLAVQDGAGGTVGVGDDPREGGGDADFEGVGADGDVVAGGGGRRGRAGCAERGPDSDGGARRDDGTAGGGERV